MPVARSGGEEIGGILFVVGWMSGTAASAMLLLLSAAVLRQLKRKIHDPRTVYYRKKPICFIEYTQLNIFVFSLRIRKCDGSL
jgi:hypothetical protein